MKKWQDECNYSREKDSKGNVSAYFIEVDGIDVEVSQEVYHAYTSQNRRERYVEKQLKPQWELSLEKMQEEAVPLDKLTVCSAEDQWLEQEKTREAEKMRQLLLAALLKLKDADRELITGLFFDGKSVREYAKMTGVSDMAVRKRRDRILKRLQKFFR